MERGHVSGLAVTAGVLAVAAVAAVVFEPATAAPRVGWLLALGAVVEGIAAQRRSSESRQSATLGAVISAAIALALINAPAFVAGVLRWLVVAWLAADAARGVVGALRGGTVDQRRADWLSAAGVAAVVILLVVAPEGVIKWGIALVGCLRLIGIVWAIVAAPPGEEHDESVVRELGLSDLPNASAIAEEVVQAERARRSIDRGWMLAFLVTLFAIHLGRMPTEPTVLGALGPAVAVAGDALIAIALTFLVINPAYLLWRRPTRWIERRAWRLYDESLERPGGPSWAQRSIGAWLRRRLSLAIRLREGRHSIPAALERALQLGLPIAAILAATVPVWGMSWYFDTENWASGIWNSWAESRTDTWREAMARAVVADQGLTPATFDVTPSGLGTDDFAFVVIGDPGEGDASQQVLRDRILAVTADPAVRFLLVSSDVVYPAGAMYDYEAKFFLQFKGVSQPVYAIPGNHDWYDALEGFAATFLEPRAARTSMRARVEADNRLTSTTDARIDGLVAEAARLRGAYGVRTGLQTAPFFEVQTRRFALLAIDTGVLRDVDPAQSAWLDVALARARGKLIMAVLGHPFYAGGHDTTIGDEAFGRLKQRLVAGGVAIVMAGDTHDLEYYREDGGAESGTPVHHVVNGGGGAYLSFGTSLAWPARPATTTWAFYPATEPVRAKIQHFTPWWKRPLWWWTDRAAAWPFTPEWLSAAFDYNAAPFFQSFVEVRVEPSQGVVRLRPHGVHGRLRWRDLGRSADLRSDPEAAVEWIVPLLPPPHP